MPKKKSVKKPVKKAKKRKKKKPTPTFDGDIADEILCKLSDIGLSLNHDILELINHEIQCDGYIDYKDFDDEDAEYERIEFNEGDTIMYGGRLREITDLILEFAR